MEIKGKFATAMFPNGTCLISPVTVPLICMRLPHSGQHGALLQLVRIGLYFINR